MKNYFRNQALSLLLLSFIGTGSFAQCKVFVRQTAEKLAPYNQNEQMHNAILQPGDHTEITMTFMAGQAYRILMNSADPADGIAFFVKDENDKLLYKSTDPSSSGAYDFVSESTQRLTVEMVVPQVKKDPNTMANSCVSVMVGSKEE